MNEESFIQFVKAEPHGKADVLYFADDGRIFIFSGGTRTWRNSNPGNLAPGKVSKRNGQIGVAAKFAVFPDYEYGHEGLLDCLKTTYGKANLTKLIFAYAPDFENDTKRYLKFLQKSTGVYDDRPVQNFTDEEFRKLWIAIEKMEGWKEGKITELLSIDGVEKRKGTIVGYHVSGLGWISKKKGVSLARKGKINAVLVYGRTGCYLRSFPDDSTWNNFSNMESSSL